jgi:hypothetical protein
MELTIDGEPDTTTATEQKVTAAVEAMESFVILAASADHYLQIAEPDGALVLSIAMAAPTVTTGARAPT